MNNWERIGSAVRTQIHAAEIVYDGAYHLEHLVETEALWVTQSGVVGVRGGEAVLDYHHRDHPELRAFKPGRQMSIGFTGHYGVMADRFGSADIGVGAENLIVDHAGVLTAPDLAAGIRIESEDGVIELIGAAVAEPCVPFTKFMLGEAAATTDTRSLAAHQASLGHGIRGFVMALTDLPDSGARVVVGAEVYRRVTSKGNP